MEPLKAFLSGGLGIAKDFYCDNNFYSEFWIII